MVTEQVERRVWGESLVELINEPLDMSQQVEDGGGFDEKCNAGVSSCPQISTISLGQLECSKGKSTSDASNI